MPNYLAVDLGAESGRIMLGRLSADKLTVEEVHRFPNQPVELPSGLYWDSFRLHHEIVHGLSITGRDRKLRVDGIAVDSWGVDFALTGPDGGLLECPRHYRDRRTNGVPERLFEVVPQREVFDRTGIQVMQINTLYQLYAMRLLNAPALDIADRLLFIPDLFSYWLTGVQRAETTIASTSQFYDPVSRRFATELLDQLGIPVRLLPDLIEPGDRLGTLLPSLAETTGLKDASVYATAAHDTASAVAAVPAEGNDWCYISSGTWSLMGVELCQPVITERSRELNYTNEAGAGGSILLHKNMAGLWLLQECRRTWSSQGEELSYADLFQMAEEASPARSILDPDQFQEPGDMPRRIVSWCRDRDLRPPETKGEICRVILESLARRYGEVIDGLETLSGRRIRTIYIVGGGARISLLNRLVASATGRTVIAGPTEATAVGNILLQAIGSGQVANAREAREIVSRSFSIEEFKPDHHAHS
jgi:rhamnulokinase